MATANVSLFWDKVAPKYAASPIRDMKSYEMTLAKTKGYLRPEDHVLEIGAGTASTALLLAPHCEDMVVTDISDKMLDVGREKAWNASVRNLRFEQRDAADMPDGPFDTVLAHNILHLVEDLQTVLRAAHGALRPGGLLISKTFLKPKRGLHLEYRLTRLALPVMQRLGKAPFVAFRTRPDFESAFRDAGFDIVESGYVPTGHTSLYLVCRKA